jgi:hypothetical protein
MILRRWPLFTVLAMIPGAGIAPEEVTLLYRKECGPVAFAAGRLRTSIEELGHAVRTGAGPSAGPSIRIDVGPLPTGPESFAIRRTGREIRVTGADPAGAMYGGLDLAEQLRLTSTLEGIAERSASPRFPFRAVKFNLPWMSYRKHEALSLHHDTCRDLKFWERFLDMMAENRFNTLTLWNLHPFSFMIRPKNFPEACGFTDAQLADWQGFWRALFRKAKDRGIETYIVNWNIFVSPELAKARGIAAYSADWSYFGEADTSELVERYTRECVTQLIDEYEDLAGIGISLGERMGKMTPQQREDWALRTIVEGMKQAKRPAKLIHRAPFSAGLGSGGSASADTERLTRAGIEGLSLPPPVWVEFKFNWSHGHSSPHLGIVHGGKLNDTYWNPLPKNYKLAWMIRNEDFFMLRWGEPGFIREHLRRNGQDYVGGYFVGSECYIPAKDYFRAPGAAVPWDYAFERQWLFYKLWGRLLYDPATPDAVFAAEFDRRHGKGTGEKLLEAFTRASRMPLRLASFHRATWDFTLYSEGFLAPAASDGKFDKASPFISIDELIDHKTLDPSYISIPDFVKAGIKAEAGRVSPPALADALEEDGRKALEIAGTIQAKEGSALAYETADVKAWAHLSLYFADKLRAGVALEAFRREKDPKEKGKAIAFLERAAGHWDALVEVTRPLYPEVPLVHIEGRKFSWAAFRDQVARDLEIARRAE